MKLYRFNILLIATTLSLVLNHAVAQPSDQDKNKKDKSGYNDQSSGRQGSGGYGRRQSDGGYPYGGSGKGNSGYRGNGNAYGRNGESSPQSRSSEAPGHEKQSASDRPAQTAPNTPPRNGDHTSQGQDHKQTGNPPNTDNTHSTQPGERSTQP